MLKIRTHNGDPVVESSVLNNTAVVLRLGKYTTVPLSECVYTRLSNDQIRETVLSVTGYYKPKDTYDALAKLRLIKVIPPIVYKKKNKVKKVEPNYKSRAMEKITDETIMWFGKHIDKKMGELPGSYLIWMYEHFSHLRPDLKAYIEENMEILKKEQERMKLTNDQIDRIINFIESYDDHRSGQGLCCAMMEVTGCYPESFGIILPDKKCPGLAGFVYCWPLNKYGDKERIKFLENLKNV